VFRRQWVVDLTYFFINSLLIETLTILTLMPALIFFDWARIAWSARPSEPCRSSCNFRRCSWSPIHPVLGAPGISCHPLLWPFHAIHHSVEELDWLAGSRLHLVDVVVTRGLTYVPIFVLGFSREALTVYVFLVAAQATFIHANVRWEFRRLRKVLATPLFHHWHHSAEREAVDKNFAIHTPIWDLLFGTYHLPDRWPAQYGLCGKRRVPARWVTQFAYPFRRRTRRQ
jgi:lathosterol oxidase